MFGIEGGAGPRRCACAAASARQRAAMTSGRRPTRSAASSAGTPSGFRAAGLRAGRWPGRGRAPRRPAPRAGCGSGAICSSMAARSAAACSGSASACRCSASGVEAVGDPLARPACWSRSLHRHRASRRRRARHRAGRGRHRRRRSLVDSISRASAASACGGPRLGNGGRDRRAVLAPEVELPAEVQRDAAVVVVAVRHELRRDAEVVALLHLLGARRCR